MTAVTQKMAVQFIGISVISIEKVGARASWCVRCTRHSSVTERVCRHRLVREGGGREFPHLF